MGREGNCASGLTVDKARLWVLFWKAGALSTLSNLTLPSARYCNRRTAERLSQLATVSGLVRHPVLRDLKPVRRYKALSCHAPHRDTDILCFLAPTACETLALTWITLPQLISTSPFNPHSPSVTRTPLHD